MKFILFDVLFSILVLFIIMVECIVYVIMTLFYMIYDGRIIDWRFMFYDKNIIESYKGLKRVFHNLIR